MKKNFIMAIAGGIGITSIIIIVAFYNNQELEKIVIEKPVETKLDNDILKTPVVSGIDKKLNEIEKKANENYYEVPPIEWIKRGPFEIDRSEYRLGQKIFIRIGELGASEKGEIAFLRPLNETYVAVWQTTPFDGSGKPTFNFYTQPSLSRELGICTVDDIIGEWIVVFRGTDYPNFKFEIIDKFIPGEEDAYVPVC